MPPELAAVLDRMLAKQPDDRFQTPAEVADALAPFSAASNVAALLQPMESDTDNARTEHWKPDTDPHLMSAMTGTKPDEQALPALASGVRDQGLPGTTVEEAPSVSPIICATPPVRRRQPPKLLVGLGGLAAAIALATIIIVIKNRKGEVVGQVEVPDGNSAVVLKDGKEVATTEGPTKPPREGEAPAEPPTTPTAVDKVSTQDRGPGDTEPHACPNATVIRS